MSKFLLARKMNQRISLICATVLTTDRAIPRHSSSFSRSHVPLYRSLFLSFIRAPPLKIQVYGFTSEGISAEGSARTWTRQSSRGKKEVKHGARKYGEKQRWCFQKNSVKYWGPSKRLLMFGCADCSLSRFLRSFFFVAYYRVVFHACKQDFSYNERQFSSELAVETLYCDVILRVWSLMGMG